MTNVTRLDERRAGVDTDFLSEEDLRKIHDGLLRELADDPLARVETLRLGYESLSCRLTLSQMVGMLFEASGKAAGLATQVGLGRVDQAGAAVAALEDAAALALEAARTLREQGAGAA